MVGLLNVPLGTRLFQRLKAKNRLISTATGNNMDGTLNFIPKLNAQKLIKSYKEVLEAIYSQRAYYERVKTFLREYRPQIHQKTRITISEFKALLRSFWKLGLREKGKRYYWKLFFVSLFKYPKKFPIAMTLAVYGFHFRKIVEQL